jgi:hypothetical protein
VTARRGLNNSSNAINVSDNSIDSSIDEDMLDKIKNIYSEMRKQTAASSQYYGGGGMMGNSLHSNINNGGFLNNFYY